MLHHVEFRAEVFGWGRFASQFVEAHRNRAGGGPAGIVEVTAEVAVKGIFRRHLAAYIDAEALPELSHKTAEHIQERAFAGSDRAGKPKAFLRVERTGLSEEIEKERTDGIAIPFVDPESAPRAFAGDPEQEPFIGDEGAWRQG